MNKHMHTLAKDGRGNKLCSHAIIQIDNTQITLNERAALRSTSHQSNEPCVVAQYPQQSHGNKFGSCRKGLEL